MPTVCSQNIPFWFLNNSYKKLMNLDDSFRQFDPGKAAWM